MSKFTEKRSGVIMPSDLKTIKGKTVYWVCFALMVFTALFTVVPTIWVIFTAFKDTQEIYQSFSFFPSDLTWDKITTRIAESWQDMDMGLSIMNTLVLSFGNVAFDIVFNGLAGYVLSRLKPKGHKVILFAVLWTMMMPAQLRIVPKYISYMSFPFASGDRGISLMDTYLPFWFTSMTNTFSIFMFKNAFDSVSISLVEAARIDGCTDMKIFTKIMVPLAMPTVIYLAINAVNASWSDFLMPYLVLKSDSKLITPVKIFLAKSDNTIPMNSYLMGLIIASIPPFILFAIFQKHILGGVNVGGVKG